MKRIHRWAAAAFSLSLLTSGLTGLPVAHAAASGPVTEWGYIPMDDGAQLRDTVLRPAGASRFPTLVTHSPYSAGTDVAVGSQTPGLVRAGYAVVGLNFRGTGCSTGSLQLFQYSESVDA